MRARLADALAVVTRDSADAWRESIAEVAGGDARWLVRPHGIAVVTQRYEHEFRTPADRLIPPWAITDPAEAWEALAARGVIPLAWVDDARRRFHFRERTNRVLGPDRMFADLHLHADGSAHYERNVLLAHPPTIAACVAMASDVAGVLAVEAIARQQWPARASVIEWRFVDHDVRCPLPHGYGDGGDSDDGHHAVLECPPLDPS